MRGHKFVFAAGTIVYFSHWNAPSTLASPKGARQSVRCCGSSCLIAPQVPQVPQMPQLAPITTLKFGKYSGEIGDGTWRGPSRPLDSTCSHWVPAEFNSSYCVGSSEEENLGQLIRNMTPWSGVFGDASAAGADCSAAAGCMKYGTPVWHCMDGTTRILLVGPFSSQVQTWHAIMTYFRLLNDGDRVVRFTGDTVMVS